MLFAHADKFPSGDGFQLLPHGACFLWKPEIVWLHVISDFFIFCAYMMIPILLFIVVKRVKDTPYIWTIRMFAAFILWCGMTHLVDIITIWKPWFVFQGIVKAITAAVSVATAILVIPMAPHLVDLLKGHAKNGNGNSTGKDHPA